MRQKAAIGMREVGRVSTGEVARPGRAGRQRQAGFTIEREAGAPEATATASVGPVGLGLLALQAAEDPAARDREAERRVESILQELRELQLGLLGEGPGEGRLERLAALEAGELGADPRLREVVRAVVLRARVELARRGRTGIVSTT